MVLELHQISDRHSLGSATSLERFKQPLNEIVFQDSPLSVPQLLVSLALFNHGRLLGPVPSSRQGSRLDR